MIKKSLLILLTFSVVGFSTPIFPVYDYTVKTNSNGDITSITFDWYEFLKVSEELSELRIAKTNCERYIQLDENLVLSEKKIDKYEKLNFLKKQSRNILIVTAISLIVGFFGGLKLASTLP